MFDLRSATLLLLLLFPLARAAVVTGRLQDKLGQPIPEATVVVQATWATTTTSPRGLFTVEIPAGGSTLRFTAPTGESLAVDLLNPPAEDWVVTLPIFAQDAVEMDSFVVLPSRFPVGDLPGAQMNSLDAVLTPGSLADFNRALQTLPGADAQDEGDALYVRGGDANETGVFINGARYQQIRDEETPIGTFVGSINPFLAESIRFEAGGFGASRGDLLSALVEVESVGRPAEAMVGVNVGLGAVSGEVARPLGRSGGVHVTATRRDVAPIFSANGSSRSFVRAPHGHDFSALATWDANGGASLKFFGIEQTNTLAVRVERAEGDSVYRSDSRRRQMWLSTTRTIGQWDGRLDASWAQTHKTEEMADWHWRNETDDLQLLGRAQRRWADRASVGAGFEAQQTRSAFTETVPTWRGQDRPRGDRVALWSEADWMMTDRWRVVSGLRTDHSNRGGGTTVDPRLASGYRIAPHLDLSFAWGVYHQRPDLLATSWLRRSGALASQRARHHIVALAYQQGDWQARVEAYQKTYDRLWLFTPERTVRFGTGSAQGIEVSGRFPLPERWKGRLSVSVTDAERTDGRTGKMAPYGIGYSSAVIVQRSFNNGLQVGLTWRQASGKRFTPIDGADFDPGAGMWTPRYGEPNSRSLRTLQRLDFLASRIREINSRVTLVTYLSISNVLGRSNQYDVTYSEDYRDREPVRSNLNRIIYVGFTLQFR